MAIEPIDIIFDMETQDPDDYLTLLLLLGHPAANLKAVTITPGTAMQVGLVRRTLDQFGVDIPIGAFNIDHPKDCVSSWHETAFGRINPSKDALPGGDLLADLCTESTTLLTGAPLKNLGAAMKRSRFTLGRWVAQGGFAGEGVVDRAQQLDKFKGLRICPTYNLNGDPTSALAALQDDRIGQRWFVAKNVCHGVWYDERMHREVEDVLRDHDAPALQAIHHGMDVYLTKARKRAPQPQLVDEAIPDAPLTVVDQQGDYVGMMQRDSAVAFAQQRHCRLALVAPRVGRLKPVTESGFEQAPSETRESKTGADRVVGKKFHDPLAACCALQPQIGQWAEVELFREKGKWGSRLATDTRTWIITDYNRERFLSTFLACR